VGLVTDDTANELISGEPGGDDRQRPRIFTWYEGPACQVRCLS
jgi:hypothetical protein